MSLENEVVEKKIVADIQEKEQEKASETNNQNNTENNAIDAKEEVKEEHPITHISLSIEAKFVEKKSINLLSQEEQVLIIPNARDGVNQPYFNIKFYKNERTQITKKKETPHIISSKIRAQNAPDTKEAPVYYTDNQLLFEHIIELTAKVD